MTPFLKTYSGTGAFAALETASQDPIQANAASTKPPMFVGKLVPLAANNASLQLADNSAGNHPVTLAAPVTGVAYESYECRVPTDLTTIFLKGNGMTLQALGHLVQ